MAGKIIMWIVSFGCGALFFAIGSYAKKLEKPMWVWSGTEVKASEITDVKQYNKANGIMWQLYSLWYFAAGIAEIWDSMLSFILMILSCTVGLVILVVAYKKIYNKYKAE